MNLTFVTPEKKVVVNLAVDEIFVPGYAGELNILPGHAPLVTTLTTGLMRWKPTGSATFQQAVVSWGYCEVSPEGVSVLADVADLPSDVDLNRGRTILKEAEQRLQNETLTDVEYAELNREIDRVHAQQEMMATVRHH